MTAGGPIVCRGMTGPGKSAETILSRRNILKTARGLSADARNICANSFIAFGNRNFKTVRQTSYVCYLYLTNAFLNGKILKRVSESIIHEDQIFCLSLGSDYLSFIYSTAPSVTIAFQS